MSGPVPASSVADPGCLSRIRFFPSRILVKEFKYFYPQKMVLSSKKYDPGCSSRIRMLTFYPSRIQGSKRHPIPDPQHCLLVDRLGTVGPCYSASVYQLTDCVPAVHARSVSESSRGQMRYPQSMLCQC